jgi:exodeoxyribonuclease VII small subunit
VTKKSDQLPDLETSFTEISSLIEKMESNELTLEQSLTHFERGIALIKHCQKILKDAEQKVQILIQNNNQEELTAYNQKGQASDENKNPDELE